MVTDPRTEPAEFAKRLGSFLHVAIPLLREEERQGTPVKTIPELSVNRLRDLFGDLSNLIKDTKRHSEKLETSLRRYLSAATPLLREEESHRAPIKTIPELNFDRLRDVLGKLSELIKEAKQQGDFIDIWSVAGLGKNEGRNAAVLAWLLNPNGSHGQGFSILRSVLERVRKKRPGCIFEETELARVSVQTEHQPLDEAQERVDISLYGPSFIAFIEVKIGAVEGPDQLKRYVVAAQKKQIAYGKQSAHVIYLAPRRRHSGNQDVIEITWLDIADAIHEAAENASGMGRIIIQHFAQHIRAFN